MESKSKVHLSRIGKFIRLRSNSTNYIIILEEKKEIDISNDVQKTKK